MIEQYKEYPPRNEMAEYLTNINLGYEPEKDRKFDWFKLAKRKSNDIEKYWLACKLTNNLGDISRIHELPYADFWTVSFPCVDVSVAGKMKGLNPDSGTRSSLLWENIRLLKKAKENNTLPKYILIENVKNLVSKRFIDSFNNLIQILDDLGFNTYWSVINGKDCGTPQNRERVFAIVIRKDIDTKKFTFPKPFDNGVRLKDILEDDVDEKFYISDEKVKSFISNLQLREIHDNSVIDPQGRTNKKCIPKDVAPTLRAQTHGNLPQIIEKDKDTSTPKFIGSVNNINFHSGYSGGVFDADYVSPTLTSMQGGGQQPHVIQVNQQKEDSNNLKQLGYINNYNGDANRVYSDDIARTLKAEAGGGGAKTGLYMTKAPKIIKMGNINPSGNGMNGNVFSEDGLSPTVTINKGEGTKIAVRQATKKGFIECDKGGVADFSYPSTPHRGRVQDGGNICPTLTTFPTVHRLESTIRIRKLTPRECWILMGLTSDDCDKAKSLGIADSNLYKQAGNGIITNCCSLIAEHLYKAQYDESYICTDENFTNPQAEKEME